MTKPRSPSSPRRAKKMPRRGGARTSTTTEENTHETGASISSARARVNPSGVISATDANIATRLPAVKSKAEEMLALHIRACGIPAPEREHRFSPPRRWRFDFAWPAIKLAVEVDGVTGGAGGRHQRIDGYERDLEKLNAAVLRGWRVLRFTPRKVKNGAAMAVIMTAMKSPDPAAPGKPAP